MFNLFKKSEGEREKKSETPRKAHVDQYPPEEPVLDNVTALSNQFKLAFSMTLKPYVPNMSEVFRITEQKWAYKLIITYEWEDSDVKCSIPISVPNIFSKTHETDFGIKSICLTPRGIVVELDTEQYALQNSSSLRDSRLNDIGSKEHRFGSSSSTSMLRKSQVSTPYNTSKRKLSESTGDQFSPAPKRQKHEESRQRTVPLNKNAQRILDELDDDENSGITLNF